MKTLRLLLAVATSLLLSATAHAQLFRAYISSTGNDANPCTLPSPCRLLPAALTAVAPSGEIWMLDSANYNTAPVAITKSVTILAIPGAVGSVVTTSGPAISIATGGLEVVLRNLVVTALPGTVGGDGVRMTANSILTIEGSVMANVADAGVFVSIGRLRMTDTTIRGNTTGVIVKDGGRGSVTRCTVSGNAGQAVLVWGTLPGFNTTGDVADSTLDDNLYGISAFSSNATSTVSASVTGSRLLRNSNAGAYSTATNNGPVALSVSNNIISNNNRGIMANSATARVIAGGNTVSGNAVGLYNNLSTLESAGNNIVRNNTGANFGAVSIIGLQ